jgi:4-carboxymuconolactone decarboxylase
VSTDHPRGVFADGSRTLCEAATAARDDHERIARCGGSMELDYTERLRRLTINDPTVAATALSLDADESLTLDPKAIALVRLAAIVAVRGAVASLGAQSDSALAAGASTSEIVDVLVAVAPIVGLPCTVAAAPLLALALGYDLEDDL